MARTPSIELHRYAVSDIIPTVAITVSQLRRLGGFAFQACESIEFFVLTAKLIAFAQGL
jgi:hypothetical protein